MRDVGPLARMVVSYAPGHPQVKKLVDDTLAYFSAPAGGFYRFTPEDVDAIPHPITSLHQVGLLETLAMAQHLGCRPQQIDIIGVEPKVVDWGMELSPEVAAMVPAVVELVLTEIA